MSRKVSNFKPKISPSAALVFSAAVFFLDAELIFCLFLSVLCHEAGHCAAMYVFGIKPTALSISALGLNISYDNTELSYGAEAFLAISGPLIGAILSFLASVCGLELLAGMSAVLTVFNLMPVHPLDGGRITEKLLMCIISPSAAHIVLLVLGITVSIFIILFGIYTTLSAENGTGLILLGIYLISECIQSRTRLFL